MKTSDFSFDLPEELIAQHPTDRRGESRLLVLDRATGERHHSRVKELSQFLNPGTLLVFNNTRVRKARLFGVAANGTGGTAGEHTEPGAGPREFLLLNRLSSTHWRVMARNSKRIKPGRVFHLPEDRTLSVIEVTGPYRTVEIVPAIDEPYLARHGHVPLPPYIRREDAPSDEKRYQTVYASAVGSIAAPTAGLHFTPAILDDLRRAGISTAEVTLHVGIGTFEPIRTEHLTEHRMHTEEYHISPTTADVITEARRAGRTIVAVGTTVVRTLESAWDPSEKRIVPGQRGTELFIYPGYRFQVIDHMFTNFHTPRSTLLAMVSAFGGRDVVLGAYKEAVRRRYRFFSYGDAMLIR